MALKITTAEMVANARARIEEITATDAIALANDPSVQIVDLRDPRERERTGFIPGSFHCPRGMLEFWIDPESPYFKEQFGEDRKFVFFCAGGWRSALAAKTSRETFSPSILPTDDKSLNKIPPLPIKSVSIKAIIATPITIINKPERLLMRSNVAMFSNFL